MDSYMLPFIVRDALLCLIFLVGMAAGVVAITRNQKKVGAFLLSGFLLLGLDPIAEAVIFNVLFPQLGNDGNYLMFNWVYVCIGAPATILGIASLLAGFYFALKPASTKSGGQTASNEPMAMDSEK